MSGEAVVQLPAQPKGANSIAMVAVLGGVAMLSGLLIALSYHATLPTIKVNQQRMLERAVFDVLPGAVAKTTFVLGADGALEKVAGEAPPLAEKLYAGYDEQGQFLGVAIEASGQGYQDIIRVIYGLSPETQTIIGFGVLETKETPGLGDKIATDPTFLANFEALDVRLKQDKSGLLNPVEAVKGGQKTSPWQIDGISGATISSKAVGDMLNLSAQKWAPFVQQHLEELKAGAP